MDEWLQKAVAEVQAIPDKVQSISAFVGHIEEYLKKAEDLAVGLRQIGRGLVEHAEPAATAIEAQPDAGGGEPETGGPAEGAGEETGSAGTA